MHRIISGFIRFLGVALLAALLAPTQGRAATIQWQAMPDRERVIISIQPGEGLPGQVGRIDQHALTIPFTTVPPGLNNYTPPPESRIFHGTRQLGTDLVLTTKTPAFGFVVPSRSPAGVTIDFFDNPLGSRWRPSQTAAPTVELPTGAARGPESQAAPSLADQPQAVVPAPQPPAQDSADQPNSPSAATRPAATQPLATGIASAPSTTAAHSAATQVPANAPLAPSRPVQTGAMPNPSAQPDLAAPAVPVPDRPELPQTQPQAVPDGPIPQISVSAPRPANPQATPDLNRSLTSPSNLGRETIGHPGEPGTNRPSGLPPALSEAEVVPVQPEGYAPSAAIPPVQSTSPEVSRQPEPQAAATPPVTDQTGPSASLTPQNPGDADQHLSSRSPASALPAQPVPGSVTNGSSVYEGRANTGTPPALSSASPSGNDPAALSSSTPIQPEPDGPRYADGSSQTGASGDGMVSGQASLPGQEDGQEQEQAQELYVDLDENGNPILIPSAALKEIFELTQNGQYGRAFELVELLLEQGLMDSDQLEEALHARAECLFMIHRDALVENFNEISDSLIKAINYNQKSTRNPNSLLRLGYLNLQAGNLPEARARFNMIRMQYPEDDNVPLTYFHWGEYYYEHGNYQRAADEFQYVLQHYANHKIGREASLGLAESFYQMGYFKEAFDVVNYIERRWERFYIDQPQFLLTMGEAAFRLNEFPSALKHYWTYINIAPTGKEADVTLTRLGDIYSAMKEKSAARELYQEALKRFPDKDGGLAAMMRLAEDGVYDEPSIKDMFFAFDEPLALNPYDVYNIIINDYPDSEFAPLATLKLAMWFLWRKDYDRTMKTCADFFEKYPGDELEGRVKDLALNTFTLISAESVANERYRNLMDFWMQYEFVREAENRLRPESRISMGVAFRDSGKPDEAIAIVEPLFLGNKVPEYSEMALNLILGIYLNYDQWQNIRVLARQIDLWELTPEAERTLDYALALAAENLGESDAAAPLWQKTYDTGRLSPMEQATAAFFLARSAERNRELERAYLYGKEALSRLMDLAERDPATADYAKIQSQVGSLMDVTETAGRLREALQYANQFLTFLEPDHPARPAVLYRMARIYKRQGNTDAWEGLLQELVRLYPNDTYGRMAASELRGNTLQERTREYSPST